MRKAATKVGLGFEKKISVCSLAAAEKIEIKMNMDSDSESESESKSLYLCFSEKSRFCNETYTTQVIRRIKFLDGHKEEKYLNGASYERLFKGHTHPLGLCCRIGSKIVLPFHTGQRVTHFTLYDVSKSKPKIELKEFQTPKIRPQGVVVDGKLYCIDTCSSLRYANDKYPFEVSDLAGNKNLLSWRRLDPPPFRNRKPNLFMASFLEEKRILGWEYSKAGVYCFDTTKPENGWIETSFNLGNCLPFMYFDMYVKPPIFIRHHHPVLGPFHLMFMYDPIESPLCVNFFFMLDNCDSFHIIRNTPLHLPNSYKKYTLYPDQDYYADDDDSQPVVSTDFEFVPLGGQKVCLVLNKFFPHCHRRKILRNTGTLLLLTFEYKIITTTDKSPIEIETRLLRTQRFQYHSRRLDKPGPTWTETVHMDGVFLL